MQDQRTSFEVPLPVAEQQEIDRLCSEYEAQWRQGDNPRIEDYLPKVAPPLVPWLVKELVAAEVDLRRTAGDDVQVAEYLQRFPAHATAVEAGWALIANRRAEEPGPASTQDFSRDHDQDTGGDQVEVQLNPQPLPDMIGRYKVLRELGEGGFGRVLLAQDTQLRRHVAIKVPGPKRLATAKSLEAFLEEARTAAQLKHPGLVVVHDVQQDEDQVYIVQEYIDGQDLSTWKQTTNPSIEQIVALIKEVVEAVGFAHQHDLVHRDLKPANLLVDGQGHPHVADFGLAVDENSQQLRQGEVSGTPAYMSPEQVRGLTHVLDGRSDLWSIGVILYELLTDRRPFRGASTAEIFEAVKHRDPKPPRQIKPSVPSELERICLKCLQKRQTDRYASAAELLDDLEAWYRQSSLVVSTPSAQAVDAAPATPQGSQEAGSTAVPSETKSDKQPAPRIVPKGLRSFDEHDADFFLELLPGARDRDGLPESIRFWKRRMEETDPEKTFRVGLIYGPSGCGKSSLVKAGLLPRLAAHVVPVYLEAAPEDTELRLLKGLRRRFSTIPDELALPDVLAGIREGQWVPENTKVCVVLDQFEQWLHARRAEQDTQLVQALRQCDGSRLQAVVLVRDDFWLAASRFMQDLEVDLVQGVNMVLVDLFDPLHARSVLAAFGRAYRRLPDEATALSQDQKTFLDRAVAGLAQDGKVICVRLALFADMLKGNPWTTATLSQAGGTEGLGVTFLEETFSSSTAPAAHRHHQQAAQAVLKALLPEAGSDIKGSRQAYHALLESSGYAQRPGEFSELIRILDSEIRLITPTVPEGEDVGTSHDQSADAKREEKYYQLTHDYLVPSLREWLTRKQKETRRGRAELRLAERAALWNAKPENQQLPSLWEYGSIRTLTRRREWTEPQRSMMLRAERVLSLRWGTALAVMATLVVAVQYSLSRASRRALADRLQGAVTTVANNRGKALPLALKNLEEFPSDMVREALDAQFADPRNNSDQNHSLAHALARYGQAKVVRPLLLESIATAPAEEVDNLVAALALDREAATAELWQAAQAATEQKNWELKTRCATLALYLDDTRLAAEMLRGEPPDADGGAVAAKPLPTWPDAPLDPNWQPVAEATKTVITAAHGLLEERFAYCLDLPWQSFLEIVETLRTSGYRPTRVRPFVVEGQRKVAAVWTRDALPFRLDYDQTLAQLPSPDADAVREGLVPVDMAGYLVDGQTVCYCVLWSEPLVAKDQRRLRAGQTKEEWEAAYSELGKASFRPQTLQVYVTADGTRCCAGIWSSQAAPTGADVALTQDDVRAGKVIWEDLSSAAAGKPLHPLQQQRQLLASLDALPVEEQNTPERRLARAKARYYLDQPREALADLEVLAAQTSPSAEALLYRALCQAQLGQAEEATATMAKVQAVAQDPGWGTYGQILVDAWLGKVEEVRRGLERLAPADRADSTAYYNAACAAAQLTRILKDTQPTALAVWKRQSLTWLGWAYRLGYSDRNGIDNDPDFAPLHDDPDFAVVAAGVYAYTSYAGVWRRGANRQCWVDTASSWDEVQQAAGRRLAEDARPVAVAVYVTPDASQPQLTLVWQRPRVPAPPVRVWDPVQRTQFIECFPRWSGSVEGLVEVLQRDDNAALRSGICLALGSVEKPSAEVTRAWEPVLADWYQGQPDKGVHGATDWALRAWNLTLPHLAQGTQLPVDFQWRVTKKGLTMIHIPAGQVDRPAEREFRVERKTIRIAYDFWLSDREVTAGLFLEFLDDASYRFEKPDQPEEIRQENTENPQLPVVHVSWYDAVLLCNWLSRQEGLNPCYEKAGKEKFREYDNTVREHDAWKRIPRANGYRLPTDDEWEYACRARTTTGFAFGDEDDLLDSYAMILKNAKLGPAAVGGKLCNAWGLFDMHGNVYEWCEDWYKGGVDRVHRGGGWALSASDCRSAFRLTTDPKVANRYLGFRVAAAASSE